VRSRRFRIFLVTAALLSLHPGPSAAEERTVTGSLVRLDLEERSLAVEDGKGRVWNFRVDDDTGIDLADLRLGTRVRVSIARATPLNMISAADRIRRGDRIDRIPF
jgi:hypothetical protein